RRRLRARRAARPRARPLPDGLHRRPPGPPGVPPLGAGHPRCPRALPRLWLPPGGAAGALDGDHEPGPLSQGAGRERRMNVRPVVLEGAHVRLEPLALDHAPGLYRVARPEIFTWMVDWPADAGY